MNAQQFQTRAAATWQRMKSGKPGSTLNSGATAEPVRLEKYSPHFALSKAEASQLAACEKVIAQGLETFWQVGEALIAVREKKLYRAEFETFESYCQGRWDMTARRARQLCSATDVRTNLKEPPLLGDSRGQRAEGRGQRELPLPSTESQVRPLVPLPKRQQRAAWKTAVNEVKGVPTATVVQRVVDDIKCGDGRFVRPTESSDPSAIPYSIASPAAQACWPRLKGNEEKGSTKAGDKVSDKGGNNCSQSKDSTKALGQPSRLDLIIAKVRDAILMVQHLMPLFDNTDTSARAEAQLAISRLESLEAKFVRKQRKAA